MHPEERQFLWDPRVLLGVKIASRALVEMSACTDSEGLVKLAERMNLFADERLAYLLLKELNLEGIISRKEERPGKQGIR